MMRKAQPELSALTRLHKSNGDSYVAEQLYDRAVSSYQLAIEKYLFNENADISLTQLYIDLSHAYLKMGWKTHAHCHALNAQVRQPTLEQSKIINGILAEVTPHRREESANSGLLKFIRATRNSLSNVGTELTTLGIR